MAATEAVLGPLEDSDRLGLETLLPGSPSPGPENYRCPASTPSRNFRRDHLPGKFGGFHGPRGGVFALASPSPDPNRRTAGRFSGSSLRRTCRSQDSMVLEGLGLRGSALQRKTVDYYYVDKTLQRRQAAQTNTTWLKSLCSQPVDEILKKYRRKSELQKSKMLWSKTYSTPGERALFHAWESNVLRGVGGSGGGFPTPSEHYHHNPQMRGSGMGAMPVSGPALSAEKVKGSSLSQSHHAQAARGSLQEQGFPHSSCILHHHQHHHHHHALSRSEPSVKSSQYAGDGESSVSQAEDHAPPPPPPTSAVWNQNGPAHSRGRGANNGQVFFRVSTHHHHHQQQGQGSGGSQQRLPSLSSKEKAYMFRQRKYIANGGRHYPPTLDSGGDGGQDSGAATTTVASEELSQIYSVEPTPRLESPALEEDVRLPHIAAGRQ